MGKVVHRGPRLHGGGHFLIQSFLQLCSCYTDVKYEASGCRGRSVRAEMKASRDVNHRASVLSQKGFVEVSGSQVRWKLLVPCHSRAAH